MGAGRGFTNLPVSETDVRLQSGGHMGWRRKIECVCVCVHGEGSVMMIMKKRLVRL